MADWCTNWLSIPHEKDLESILTPYMKQWAFKNSDKDSEAYGEFIYMIGLDFNKIIPMPDGIRKTMNELDDDDVEGQKDFDRRLKRLEKTNLRTHGFKNWSDWSVEHWGTKHNGRYYDFSENGEVLSFSTAWNPPYPIINQLSKLIDRSLRMRYLSEVGAIEFEGLYTAYPNGDSEHVRQVDNGRIGKLVTTVRKVMERPTDFNTGSLTFEGEHIPSL